MRKQNRPTALLTKPAPSTDGTPSKKDRVLGDLDRIKARLQAGSSFASIARDLGMAPSSLGNILKDAGITVKPKWQSWHAQVQDLAAQGWTAPAIAIHLGLNCTTIRKFCRMAGIPLRDARFNPNHEAASAKRATDPVPPPLYKPNPTDVEARWGAGEPMAGILSGMDGPATWTIIARLCQTHGLKAARLSVPGMVEGMLATWTAGKLLQRVAQDAGFTMSLTKAVLQKAAGDAWPSLVQARRERLDPDGRFH